MYKNIHSLRHSVCICTGLTLDFIASAYDMTEHEQLRSECASMQIVRIPVRKASLCFLDNVKEKMTQICGLTCMPPFHFNVRSLPISYIYKGNLKPMIVLISG